MTQSKHTPAPWKIEGNEIRQNNKPTYNWIATINSGKSADRNLIAAAPDMFKALETACEIIRDSYGQDDVSVPCDCQAVVVMEKAIKKAKGQ